MKKLVSIIALSAFTLMANAQKTVQGSGFVDNWSIGLYGGGLVKTTHSNLIKDLRPTYSLELRKQITPVFGLGAQLGAANNVTSSATIIDATNLGMFATLNVNNAFWGYKGTPRFFEVEALVGLGWGCLYNSAKNIGTDHTLISRYGLNFNFNLGESKAWTITVRPALAFDLETESAERKVSHKMGNSCMELLAGVTYHFKNHNNNKHYMTLIRDYDQSEVDALNAKVNDLRSMVNEKNQENASQRDVIKNLQSDLNDCRNEKSRIQKEVITVDKSSKSLEQTITFRQGKSTVDVSQMASIERVATFLRNHENAKVEIKGYASPEGSASVNAQIAKARANSVKNILVKKYNISENRIKAEGQGVGNMFSEPDWNRVSICTIDQE